MMLPRWPRCWAIFLFSVLVWSQWKLIQVVRWKQAQVQEAETRRRRISPLDVIASKSTEEAINVLKTKVGGLNQQAKLDLETKILHELGKVNVVQEADREDEVVEERSEEDQVKEEEIGVQEAEMRMMEILKLVEDNEKEVDVLDEQDMQDKVEEEEPVVEPAPKGKGRKRRVARRREKRKVIVVLVMQTTVDIHRRGERVDGILETWGADAVVEKQGNYLLQVRFVADKPWRNETIYAVDAAWPKTQQMFHCFAKAMEEFGTSLAFIAKGDDITFWIPSNLDAFAASKESQETYIGGNLLGMSPTEQFLSGGAGFLVHGALAARLVTAWKSTCQTLIQSNEFLLRSEDVALSKCIEQAKVDTALQPAVESANELFNVYDPVRSLEKSYDSWYVEYKKNAGLVPSCCSLDTVSFHYVEPPLARFLWMYLTLEHDKIHVPGTLDLSIWPKHTGGYARKPDSPSKLEQLIRLLGSMAHQ